jgi:F-type H+-transporting ATPase subunit delta
VPLPREGAEALRRSLSTATGKQVSVVTRLEPALLGGVVVRVGSTVYDGSLARHLERLKDKLVERT